VVYIAGSELDTGEYRAYVYAKDEYGNEVVSDFQIAGNLIISTICIFYGVFDGVMYSFGMRRY
jgi:hypothetical protein